MTKFSREYDLEERTAKFGENVIKLCKTLSQDAISRPLISQIVRSSTSIGANYMEANGASSRRDFTNKIHLCRKECQESKHWLRMIAICIPKKKDELNILWSECHELILIFQKISSSLKNK